MAEVVLSIKIRGTGPDGNQSRLWSRYDNSECAESHCDNAANTNGTVGR